VSNERIVILCENDMQLIALLGAIDCLAFAREPPRVLIHDDLQRVTHAIRDLQAGFKILAGSELEAAEEAWSETECQCQLGEIEARGVPVRLVRPLADCACTSGKECGMTKKTVPAISCHIKFASAEDCEKFAVNPMADIPDWEIDGATAVAKNISIDGMEHLFWVWEWVKQAFPGAIIEFSADGDADSSGIFGMDKDEFYTALSSVKQIFDSFQGGKLQSFVQREVFGNVLDAAFAGKEPTVEEMQAAGKRARDLADAFIAGASPDDEGDEG